MKTIEFGREVYSKPEVEVVILAKPLSLLENVSVEGTIEDFEDGGEL